MDEDYKKRISGAIGKYLERQEPKLHTRKNQAPEREVVKAVLKWCELNGWSVSVINSASVYSEREDRYLTAQAPKGYPDLTGCTPLGFFAALEIKAPGKRSTMSDDQLEFLLSKITRNCFAGVFDSVKLLETTYLEWLLSSDKKTFLLQCLPRTTLREDKNDTGPLFDE